MSIVRSVRRTTGSVINAAFVCLALGGIIAARVQLLPVVDNPPPEALHTWFAEGGATAPMMTLGEYVTTVPPGHNGEPDSCHYEVFTDWDRTQSRLSGYGSAGDTLTIYILAGDKWIKATGCGRWDLVTSPA